jgi:hypothetical protein
MQQWEETTQKALRLRTLVLRIKSRVLTLFFEILQKIVDDKNVRAIPDPLTLNPKHEPGEGVLTHFFLSPPKHGRR